MAKPVLVFAGAVYPGQFGHMCEYMRREGLAETYFLTTPGHKKRNEHLVPNLISFQPDGKIIGPQGYYYSAKVERSARISRGMRTALAEFQKTKKIDAIICHSLWGAPHFLYDEIDAAILSYIEFPSYHAHGWDPDYPPDLSQRLTDRNAEMLNFHQVLKSDLTFVPSETAKAMFPPELQSKIEVQFEGFDIPKALTSDKDPEAPLTIGFAARDLSNAKGIDIFIRLVDRLQQEGFEANYVALGGSTGTTYGYEPQWVDRHYKGEVKSFKDHALRLYPAAKVIDFPGKLPYGAYEALLSKIDMFLYPLRFGVANWGLMEILMRGGCVLAPNRGYPTELIKHDVNGLLLPDDDTAWISAIKTLAADPDQRARYSTAARKMSRTYHVSKVAARYLELCQRAIHNRRARLAK